MYRWLELVLVGVGLFLSLWIVIPAPSLFLLPLGVGAPELSPALLGFNAFVFLLLWLRKATLQRPHRSQRLWLLMLVGSLAGIILSALPLLQLPMTVQQSRTAMQAKLGRNYLAQIPQSVQAQMRPQPFVLGDLFSGIPTPKVRHTSGIPFATPEGVPLSLDVYQPLKKGKYPGIVVIYGGAWRSGSPADNAEFNRYMAARGYVVWAIAYRHAPEYRFPAQIIDVQSALAFIQQHALEYETDQTRMALLGRSAGAHLAMLAAYQPSPLTIRAVIDYYGPVDLAKGYNDPPNPDPIDVRAVLRAFLGGPPRSLPQRYQQASPITYVKPSLPPSLLIYGSRDHLVQAKFGRALFQRLQAAGNTAILVEIPWAEHAFDALFSGLSNQLALYYTERFIAWALTEAPQVGFSGTSEVPAAFLSATAQAKSAVSGGVVTGLVCQS